MNYEIVIPTSGRDSLAALLDAIGPEGVIVVDDRRDRSHPLPLGSTTAAPRPAATPDGPAPSLSASPAPTAPSAATPDAPAPSHAASSVAAAGASVPSAAAAPVRVMAGPARGPAAARNAGWRAAGAEWVVFLDDDVLPPAGWRDALEADLAAADPDVAATQGRIVVPVPARPTDWERNVGGLERARWATADMAYRRDVLAAVGGFDERFPRAYREDADLGLRVTAAGRRIVEGRRHVVHPVRPASPWISITKQAGNADDVLMRRLHGRDWRERAGVPPGRRPRHLATATMGLGALLAAAFAARTARPPRRRAAAVLGAGWLAGTAELAWARIAPGPRTPREVATMLVTSVLMPFAALAWWLRGLAGATGRRPCPRPAAVLFDRDGTLIADVPYNGDPTLVEPMPGAREALARLRAAGVPVAVVSNQSGIARGLLAHADVEAIHARMEELLGPLGPLEYCPHGPDDGCGCRKPAPGLIVRAAQRLGVDPRDCVVVGDIGGDIEAAHAAGADAVLIPTSRTRSEEIDAAPRRARDLTEAIDLLVPA